MHVDGFRFDLASTLARDCTTVDQLGAFFDIIRQDPVLSQRQADRRAVGRRRGRLPGRQLPARLGRVERQVPRHACAPSGRATAACIGEFAQPPHRLERPLRPQRPAALRQRQLRHRARRLHARRPRLATTTSTTRPTARTTATATTTTLVELRRRGRRPTTPRCCALRARQKRNLLADAAPLAGHADAAGGDEIGRTQSGNNNAYCQDNEISWLDWTLDDDGEALLAFSRAHDRACAARTRCSGAATSSRAVRCAAPTSGHHVVAARRRRDERTGVAQSHARCARRVPRRATALAETDARGRAVRDDSFLLLFNAHHDADSRFRLPTLGGAAPVDVGCIDTSRTTVAADRRAFSAATPYRARRAARWRCSRAIAAVTRR